MLIRKQTFYWYGITLLYQITEIILNKVSMPIFRIASDENINIQFQTQFKSFHW